MAVKLTPTQLAVIAAIYTGPGSDDSVTLAPSTYPGSIIATSDNLQIRVGPDGMATDDLSVELLVGGEHLLGVVRIESVEEL